MDKKDVLARVKELGLLAVIRGPSSDLTIKMVEALVLGGVLGIEITYTTPDAEAVVAELSKKYGQKILLGMGTLTKAEQAVSAKKAGANFLVSPMYETNLVKSMVDSGLATMVGALTPSEVFTAYNAGTDVIKVFPGSLGGPKYIKSLKGPFPNIPMMPTGGVSADNVKDWFAVGVVAVGAGSQLCPAQAAKEGNFEEITKRAVEFVKIVKDCQKNG